jgi:hypothetical protein
VTPLGRVVTNLERLEHLPDRSVVVLEVLF